jgi:CRISPR/Cas system CMR-associated protein Cmr1 (group 7 of RAMP superfamily)
MARKRAHKDDGSFQADDPSTPENEAWVEEDVVQETPDPSLKAKQNRAPKNDTPSAFVFFVSANEENAAFDIRIGEDRVRGIWDKDRAFVHWRVPRELAEMAKKHHHVWSGRVIICEDKT